MNKALTDDIQLQPPSYSEGLSVWSSGDGTPGSSTWANASNGVFVPADQDFGAALEIQKVQPLTTIRYMGQTPITPGCFLKVTARVKVLTGNLPEIRISAYPAASNGSQVSGLPTNANPTLITSYGEVTEVSAIVATSTRSGVDLAWTSAVSYGHFGVDINGPSATIIRVDDIQIEDVTTAFMGDVLSRVDVRDYGAVGDGITDDRDAFNTADNEANGRELIVPEGTYLIGSSVTIDNPITFVGTLTMPAEAQLTLRKNFNVPDYVSAFGDEVEGFKKAFQALMDFSDFEGLDMQGLKVDLYEPV
ncbi:MAG: glycosyl hydrolase family 28-related protein, partial [Pseudomonadota bacterium]